MDEAGQTTREVTRPPAPSGRGPARLRPWLVTGGLLVVLAVLTGNVLAHGPLVSLDQHIRDAVQSRATAPHWRWLGAGRHAPAQLLTDLGRSYVAVPLLAVTAVVLAVRRHTIRPVAAAAIGVALLLTTVIPAKILIGRPGPGLTTAGAHGLGVFPSGHTTTACVCFSPGHGADRGGSAGPGPVAGTGRPGRTLAAGRRGPGVERLPLVHRRGRRLGALRAHRRAGLVGGPGSPGRAGPGQVLTRISTQLVRGKVR